MERTTRQDEQLYNCKKVLEKAGWVWGAYRGSGWYYTKNGVQMSFFTGMRQVVVKRNYIDYFWGRAKDFECVVDIRETVDTNIYLLQWTPEQKEMHQNDKYFIDGNGNAWEKKLYSLERVMGLSAMLKDCTNCINCEYCTDCISCKDCKECEHGRYCASCNYCIECEYCENCKNCKVCEECVECEKCDNCEYCNKKEDKQSCYENVDKATYFEQN